METLSAVSEDRNIWKGFYEELLNKAIAIYNENSGKTPLVADRLSVGITRITKEQWDHLINFWLPAKNGRLISDELWFSQIPGVDVGDEIDKKSERVDNMIAAVTPTADPNAAPTPPAPGTPVPIPAPGQVKGGFKK